MTLAFDPIAEARRQWEEHDWHASAPGMAAVTSVFRAHQIFLARAEDVLAPFELTFARFEVLTLLLFSTHGALPLGKIADRLQVHRTSITNAVDRLEAQAFVVRTPHPTDARTRLAGLTKAGREVTRRATTAMNAALFEDVGLSSRDLATLFSILRRLRRAAGDF
jgi:DNA-binding MarR family transcriptional regulator